MKINIIGAGITGLSAAYFFARKNYKVRIFEQASDVGGLAGSFSVNGTYLEKYYHHSFEGHTELIRLLDELNIKDRYISTNVKTGFYFNGAIYPFVSAKDLIQFKPLKMINRFRLGLTSLLMMQITDWKKLESKNALEWLERYSGQQVREVIWEPLLKMKFGDNYSNISAAWLWNRVVDRKTGNSGKDVLGYIRGGYQKLFDALIKDIRNQNGEIITESPVEQIEVKNERCTGVQANGKFYDGDIVLSTVSTPNFLAISPFLPSEYSETIKKIKYQGSVCVVIQLKKALSEYYWINISDPNSPFVGIIEHTNFIPAEAYGNKHLVYLTSYSSPQSDIFSKSDEQIYGQFSNYLKNLFIDFNPLDVEAYWVFRNKYSQPVFVKNYSMIKPGFKTPVENLYTLNIAQIYPHSRSLNSSIEIARNFVKKISSECSR